MLRALFGLSIFRAALPCLDQLIVLLLSRMISYGVNNINAATHTASGPIANSEPIPSTSQGAVSGPASRQVSKQIAGFFTPEISFAMHTRPCRQGSRSAPRLIPCARLLIE